MNSNIKIDQTEEQYQNRKRTRLKGYDYSEPGYYYVTICTHNRVNWFGEIQNGEMMINETGIIIQKCWEYISMQYDNIDLDTYCIMPNHVHGIITCRGLIHQTRKNDNIKLDTNITGVINHAPTDWMLMKNNKLTLGKIIRYFKARSSKIIHDNKTGNFKWQRSFHDHIIRTDESLHKIRQYIVNNPKTWNDNAENLNKNL